MSTKTITIPVPFVLSRARWVALGLAAGLVVAAIASPAFSPRQLLAADPATSDEHTVSVAGSGRVILSPDTADLRLGVTATAKTVKDARAQAAEAMTAVLASLRELGIADRDMQTTVLSLQPVYDYTTSPKPPRLTGYSLTNAISVTIRDLAKVGDAIDDALAAGATSCTTGTDGTCTVKSSSLSKKSTSSVKFTVNGLTKPGWAYDGVSTSITVAKP